jgi:hypothetical protein
MIDSSRYTLTCQEARKSAEDFLGIHLSKFQTEELNKLFPGCQIPGFTPFLVLRYLTASHGMTVVQMRIPKDGFASWLMPLEGKVSLALDTNRLKAWHAKTHMPVFVQMSRVMVHELAHKLLHPRLVDLKGAYSGRQFSLTSSDLEEEAWVFTFVFLAIVVGHYSLIFRRSTEGDNTPCRFL